MLSSYLSYLYRFFSSFLRKKKLLKSEYYILGKKTGQGSTNAILSHILYYYFHSYFNGDNEKYKSTIM